MSPARAAAALGALALGACGPPRSDPGPDPGAWFEESAAARGLDFAHHSGHDGSFWMPEIMAGGAALLDADGDGDLDAYLVQGGRLDPARVGTSAHALFENRGEGRFARAAGGSATLPGYGMGVAVGDVDEDGDPDLFVTHVGPNALLQNRGALRLEPVEAGLEDGGWGTSAAFLDAERDGDLDLVVVNYLDWSFAGELPCLNDLSQRDYCSPKNYRTPARSLFYVNEGGGRFRDASEASGIGTKRGNGLGVAVGDVDANGWLDVFVANDGMANHLWKNQDGQRFVEQGLLAGCGVDASGQEKAGMGVVLADLDRDLDLDLLVCNLAGETDSLYLNEQGYFVDRTALSGLAPVSRPFTRFGVGLHDFDQDGELDLFEANGRVQAATSPRTSDVYAEENLLFRGLGAGRFTEVERRGGVREPLVATSRAAAFGDVDGDGAVDVLVVNRDGPAHLLLNRRPGRGSWVLLAVRESSGRDALGATLELALPSGPERREVASASSYLASSDPRVHVGLGAARELARVTVRWVDGVREVFGPLAAERVHELRRGQGLPAQD
ncbi:MAG TPA: CRTAC1 family protein [Planctomycetota bacterium]